MGLRPQGHSGSATGKRRAISNVVNGITTTKINKALSDSINWKSGYSCYCQSGFPSIPLSCSCSLVNM